MAKKLERVWCVGCKRYYKESELEKKGRKYFTGKGGICLEQLVFQCPKGHRVSYVVGKVPKERCQG